MDTTALARPAAGRPVAADGTTLADTAQDRLGAEVRESAVLLVLSVAVTAGVAFGVQALLALVA